MKQILEKIEQNNQFIETERNKITLNITDLKLIESWETQNKIKGTPLSVFWENWNKVHTVKKNKQMTNNEELGDYNLPVIKKKKIDKKEGPVELFPSDSESDNDTFESKKRKRGKRGKKVVKTIDSGPVVDNGEEDLVENLEINDW